MPDQWIDERLPGQVPSPEFVSRLRTELTAAWRDDDDTMTFRVERTAGRRPRRALPWIVGIAAAAAAAIPVVIALRSDNSPRVDLVPAASSTTVESATAVTTVPPTTTQLTGPALLAELSAHRWVGQQRRSAPAGTPAFWIEFDPSGRGLTLFDGCTTSSVPITFDDAVLGLPGGPVVLECGGGPEGFALTPSSLTIEDSDGVRYLNFTPTDPTGMGYTLIALDSFGGPATSTNVVGYWKLQGGGILDLTADGNVGIGYCDHLGRWTLDGEQLSISGLDPARSAACAGVADPASVTQLEQQPYTARFGGNLVLDRGDTVIVLGRGSLDPTTDMLDLAAGTLYGFGLPTAAPADFVVGVVSGERGQPTFDSGWFTPASTSGVCGAGRSARVVQWGDLALGFTRVGAQDRLWSWSLGNDTQALEQRFGVPGGLPTSTPTGLGSKPPNRIAVGTTIAEIRSWHARVYDGAFAFAEITLTDAAGRPVANDDDAVQGVLGIGGRPVDVRLDRGTITWMSMKDGTSC